MLARTRDLIDEAKRFEAVRQLRGPDGVRCPRRDTEDIAKDGRDDTQPERRRPPATSNAMGSRSSPARRAVRKRSSERAGGPAPKAEGPTRPGTLAKEEPPSFGRIQRTGAVVLRRPAHVRPVTIGPLIRRLLAPGRVAYADAYDADSRLAAWGHEHRSACHAAGAFARGDDGDGSCAARVDTHAGFWSLPRSGLRPHRGASPGQLPLDRGAIGFVHKVRAGGKASLGALIGLLVAPPRNPT